MGGWMDVVKKQISYSFHFLIFGILQGSIISLMFVFFIYVM